MRNYAMPWTRVVMPSIPRSMILMICLALSLWAAESRADTEPVPRNGGIVVEEVGEGSTLEKAGVRSGDVLLMWERLPNPASNSKDTRGEIASAFDWMWLKIEQAPRGTVEISGRRDEKELMLRVQPGKWDAQVRPWMAEPLLEQYLRGQEHLATGDLAQAEKLWAEVTADDVDWHLRCWMWLRLGKVWIDHREWDKAAEVYRSALDAAMDPFAKSVLWRAVAKLHNEKKEFELARQAYQSAREIRMQIAGDPSMVLAEALTDLGIWSARRGQLTQAEELYNQALEIQQELSPGSLYEANSLGNLALVAAARGELNRAVELHEQALVIRQGLAPDSLDLAATFNDLALARMRQGNLEEARGLLEQALHIRRRRAPDSNLLAGSLNNLGIVEFDLGNLDYAKELYESALEIHRRRAPGGRDEANALTNLGLVASERGEPNEAEIFHRQALDIRHRRAPDSLEVAASLNNLSITSWLKGDLQDSMSYLQRALSIQQEVAPESLEVARSLSNLAFVLSARGDLEQAKVFLERALRIQQKNAPNSLTQAAILGNLGSLFSLQKDLDRGAEYHERALEIQQSVAPESLDAAVSLKALGAIAGESGDPKRATYYFEQALEIQQKIAPESLAVGVTLFNLGSAAADQGNLDRAESYYRHALEIQEKLSPSGLEMADLLHNLANIYVERENLNEAAELLRRALDIRNNLTPSSIEVAETLYALGMCETYRNPPQRVAAKSFFDRALQALDAQLSRLGGSHEVRAGFRAQFEKYYKAALAVDAELGNLESAFYVSERSRARSFIEQLSERDAVFTADIPDELDRQRRRIAVRYDRVQRELAGLNARDHKPQIENLHQQLLLMRGESRDVEEEIRRISPRFGALHYPQPLGFEEVRDALDPGTLLLSYSVGAEVTHVFVIQKEEPLVVHTLPIRENDLKQHVNDLREKISGRNWRRQTAGRHELARFLYKTLVQPAEEAVAQSDRLLIIPDGPLHYLPISALVRDTVTGSERAWQYLVEWKPVHFVLSATVYTEFKKLRRPKSEKAHENMTPLVAFGDPLYPEYLRRTSVATEDESIQLANFDGISDAYVRGAAERGLGFDPLPYTRQEVERIIGLYPNGQAYLKAEATEERAKAVGKDVRILHFATHGILDHRFPLNSAMVLTIPERFQEGHDNGLLQAWEILERVRIDADLVVLSACESGLGQELGGEGLIGLTRAFQYAGARTVAATLWKLGDQTTAVLMESFYRHLKAGKPKDEALRAAQIELIRRPIKVTNEDGNVEMRDASAPYYWAAFQIYGDWR